MKRFTIAAFAPGVEVAGIISSVNTSTVSLSCASKKRGFQLGSGTACGPAGCILAAHAMAGVIKPWPRIGNVVMAPAAAPPTAIFFSASRRPWPRSWFASSISSLQNQIECNANPHVIDWQRENQGPNRFIISRKMNSLIWKPPACRWWLHLVPDLLRIAVIPVPRFLLGVIMHRIVIYRRIGIIGG